MDSISASKFQVLVEDYITKSSTILIINIILLISNKIFLSKFYKKHILFSSKSEQFPEKESLIEEKVTKKGASGYAEEL